MSSIIVVTPPALEPLTLAETKDYLRIQTGFSDDDNFISGLITAARGMVEARSGRQLITQTLEHAMDSFPPNLYTFDRTAQATLQSLSRTMGSAGWSPDQSPFTIFLPGGPVQSVASIVYTDTNGSPQTLASDQYQVDTRSATARVAPSFAAGSWPATRPQMNAVVINYIVGFNTDPALVPPQAVQAMRLLVGHWYTNREAVVVGSTNTELDLAVKSLLWQIKNVRFQ